MGVRIPLPVPQLFQIYTQQHSAGFTVAAARLSVLSHSSPTQVDLTYRAIKSK